MAPRIVPTADELTRLLTEYLADRNTAPNAIAAPFDSFLRYAQAKLRTNARSARLWVLNVAIAEGAPFRVIITRHGVPTGQLVPRADADHLSLYDYERTGWFDNFETDATPKLTDHGVLNKTMGMGEGRFVISVAILTGLVIEASKQHEEIRAKRAADRIAELDAIEADHGDGIALLRGLLYSAGIPRNRSTLNIRRHSFFEGKETSTHISVDLTGEQVDALAPVLRALGVQPRVRRKPDNAEAASERVPVKADAAAE